MTAELLNLPEKEYRALDAVNWSTLRFMDKSPSAYQKNIWNPQKATVDMEFGSLAHTRLLQPEKLNTLLMVDANRGTKGFTDKIKKHPEWTPVTEIEWWQLNAWNNGYWENEYHDEFQKDPKIEHCVVWTDPDTGLKCKCKIDLFTDDFLLDLKTTKDDSEHAYWLSFAKYRTHCQFAMYKDALYELDGKERRCVVGRLEKTKPYDTMFSLLRSEVVWAGRRRYKKLLRDLATCLEKDEWPGKGRNTIHLDQFPEWQIDRDMAL